MLLSLSVEAIQRNYTKLYRIIHGIVESKIVSPKIHQNVTSYQCDTI